jgi:ABC-2 type transport system ATP-binding protein
MSFILEAASLTKTYQQYTALRQLDLGITAGEIFCLLGQNGAGKTTTINLFLGFTEASAGKALIKGKQVTVNDRETKKMIAYIPEVVQLYSYLSGLENLDYFSRLAGFKYSTQALAAFLTRAGLQ